MTEPKPLKILLATPCYNGMTHARYTGSLAQAVYEFKGLKNIDLQLKFIMSEPNIPRARNIYAATMLSQPQFTHLLFIDSDMSFHANDILKLCRHQKPVVAASYPKKKIHWERFDHRLMDKLKQVKDQSTLPKVLQSHLMNYAYSGLKDPTDQTPKGLVEVDFAATGFMLIERSVFEQMRDFYPDRKLNFDEQTYHHLNPFAYSFFDLEFDKERYLSDDYSFCHRWTSTGGEIFIDFSIQLGHHGQNAFYGDPFDLINIASDKQ